MDNRLYHLPSRGKWLGSLGSGYYSIRHVVACLFFLVSCLSVACNQSMTPEYKWTHQNWQLTQIKGIVFDSTMAVPNLIFDATNKNMSGLAGCNTFTSTYSVDKTGRFDCSPIIRTEMACDDMNLENSFLHFLETATKLKVGKNSLTFYDESGYVLLIFSAAS